MTADTASMPLAARLYIGLVVGGGMWALVHALKVWHSDDIFRFACYLVVAVVVSALKVNIPGFKGTMSVNFLFILIGVSEMSLAETMVLGCLGTWAQCVWKPRNPVKPIRVLFSVASMAIAIRGCYAFTGIFPMRNVATLLLATSLV